MERLERAIRKSQEGLNTLTEYDLSPGMSADITKDLGDIEDMHDKRLLDTKALKAMRIIQPGNHNSSQLNQFRELRTKLLNDSQGKNFTVMVTSIVPKGGASFIATNLAAAFAFDQSKTALLIDCNLKYPNVDRLFGLKDCHGLTDFLHNPDVGIEAIIQPSGIQRLRLISVGRFREIGTEFFTSQGMLILMNHLSRRYNDRFTIIDAPCFMDSADSRILMEHSDKVVLVVPYGRVTADQIESAINSIGTEKLAGVVINNQPNIGL